MQEDVCVILPTIRNPGCIRDYVENARSHGFDVDRLHWVLLTEAFCDTAAMAELVDELGIAGRIFDGPGRQAWFDRHGIGEYGDLIPDASHAQTSFGLLYLWRHGFPYGVFVDDDTRPHADVNFFGRHLENLAFDGDIERVSSDERWVNVLYQRADQHGLYPRGYPYSAMDETVTTDRTHVSDVVASQGLWTGIPDLDAVRILMDGDLDGQAQTRTTAADFQRDFVAAPGQYLTVCSMNLAFRREIVPVFYQLPMDDNQWDVGRFDDIWSGIFLKRACDVLGRQIYNGQPLCVHEKAPRSTFGDLATEVPGLELNEHLWQVIDEVGADDASFAAVAGSIAARLRAADVSHLENGAFLTHVGEQLDRWLACLERLDPDVRTPASVVTAGDD